MATRYGWPIALTLATTALISTPATPKAAGQITPAAQPRHDFDIRELRGRAAPRAADAEPPASGAVRRAVRLNHESGTVRVLDDHAQTPEVGRGTSPGDVLRTLAPRLGLEPDDVATLVLARDHVSRSNGVRHLRFHQVVDRHPVFDSTVSLHLRADGRVIRITSNAAPIDRRSANANLSAASARSEAARHADGAVGPASLTWLPVDGALRIAWHTTVGSGAAIRDVLLDAESGELLVRRSRARDQFASGRVLQSAPTASMDPRQPDAMPLGLDGTPGCPPPSNYELRPLAGPFRDPATVVSPTGRLEGNNARIFRGGGAAAATGTPAGTGWTFDFPFNSAASAETFLFFAANFAHDLFYDLGFDEPAGNFQTQNFNRGGLAGDPLHLNARAPGRNNANYVHAPDGSSPTINMFLWDGSGCWGADVDGDGSTDLDGDYDLDILIHEYHHGVSLRLNMAFTGNEAGAIGEGGGDFFAYSVNDNSTLAEYSRPGGLRSVNGKGYADWTCLLGLFCGVHDNGEIWANVLWDIRERFKADLVRGAVRAATNEVHQLYIDGLALSPPAPTMLDLRDAMLLADSARNEGDPVSGNFCRLWESFAGRGMGVGAIDTADSGLNRVTAAYDVPAGCVPPPGPPLVSIVATLPNAAESPLTAGAVTIRRDRPSPHPLTVSLFTGGSATAGVDYTLTAANATIPAGATETTISIVPVDDSTVEPGETVTLTVRAGSGYTIGSPSYGAVTITSNDVAADLTVTSLVVPARGAPGGTLMVGDTTSNTGSGSAVPSQTRFYLSKNAVLDAADALIGFRAAGELPVGASTTMTTSVLLPDPLQTGTYFLFAKADGRDDVLEISESNNIRAGIVAIGPDVVVTALTAPSAGAAGGTIAIADTTANQGAGAVTGASLTRFYLSVNATIDATDLLLAARVVPPLAAAALSSGSTTVTIPVNAATGTYYLLAMADADATVAELSELNNTRSTVIRVGPDLVVSGLAAPTRAAAGGTIVVTDTTRNAGSGAAAASSTAFYLSANFSLDAADVRLPPTRPVPALAPNGLSTIATTLTLPDVAAGLWYLLANADDAGSVRETQETNNVKLATVFVGPDLVFATASSPTTAAGGSSISVSTNLRNAGGGPASPSTVRFYLSINTSLDAADIQLNATRSVPLLAPDASHSAATVVPLPAGTTGNLYLLMVADADQAVAESAEGNNIAARVIQIAGG